MSGRQTCIEVIVGKNIRCAREALGWKQEELAERAGVARSTISKIESGATATSGMLSSIADALAIPPYMLMLRPIDCKRLAVVATCQSKIEDFQRSGQEIDPAVVERIQEMSASPLKNERREAVGETNAAVAKILGMSQRMEADTDAQKLEQSRAAGTGIVTKLLPSFPIINGLIANLISA